MTGDTDKGYLGTTCSARRPSGKFYRCKRSERCGQAVKRWLVHNKEEDGDVDADAAAVDIAPVSMLTAEGQSNLTVEAARIVP